MSRRGSLADVFAGMPKGFLECRDWGHDIPRGKVPAEPVNHTRIVEGVARRVAWQRTFPACNRCGVERVQEIDHRGYIVASFYKDYDPDYSVKGFGHLDRDDLALMRLANLKG